MAGTRYRHGDVLLVPFPFSDLQGMRQQPSQIRVDKLFPLEPPLIRRRLGMIGEATLRHVRQEFQSLISGPMALNRK